MYNQIESKQVADSTEDEELHTTDFIDWPPTFKQDRPLGDLLEMCDRVLTNSEERLRKIKIELMSRALKIFLCVDRKMKRSRSKGEERDFDLEHEFGLALDRNQVEAVRDMLCRSPELARSPDRMIPPLHTAASNAHYEMVRLLLAFGADPNETGRFFDSTPLRAAIDTPWRNEDDQTTQNRIRIVRALIDAGADVNRGDPPIIAAAGTGNTVIMRELMNIRNLDVNAQSEGMGVTALMEAVYRRHPQIVRMLLNANADVRLRNVRGPTALEIARQIHRQRYGFDDDDVEQIIQMLEEHEALIARGRIEGAMAINRAAPHMPVEIKRMIRRMTGGARRWRRRRRRRRY